MRSLEGRVETLYEFEGGSNPMSYYTRGHVDKDEFAAEVRRYCAELDGKYDWWDSTEYDANDVEHTWWRNVPVGPDMPGQVVCYPCDGPARGAYTVTEIDLQRASWRRLDERRRAAE